MKIIKPAPNKITITLIVQCTICWVCKIVQTQLLIIFALLCSFGDVSNKVTIKFLWFP